MLLNKRTTAFIALSVASGVALGLLLTNRVSAQSESTIFSQLRLFGKVLELVQANYVEEVDPTPLIRGAIDGHTRSF